jgi:hypothetical protein
VVAKADKRLARLRNDPRDWTMGDLMAIAARHGLDWRQPGTSHRPGHKQIKPIYLKRFFALLDRMGNFDGE